jgi:hypothetical protein
VFRVESASGVAVAVETEDDVMTANMRTGEEEKVKQVRMKFRRPR